MSKEMKNDISSHIVKNSDVCGGRACINGHRIRVMDIVVWHELRNYSVDEIVSMFPGITPGDVHAALTYFFDHPQEIRADIAEDESVIKAKKPSKVSNKLSA